MAVEDPLIVVFWTVCDQEGGTEDAPDVSLTFSPAGPYVQQLNASAAIGREALQIAELRKLGKGRAAKVIVEFAADRPT